MLFIEGQCPHCNEKRGFNLWAMSEYRSERISALIKQDHSRKEYKNGKKAQYYACGICYYCKNPVLVDIFMENDALLYTMRECISNQDKMYDGPSPQVIRTYPQPVPPYTHPSLPPEVNKDLEDMHAMIKAGFAPHLVMTGCRTVLETAVKALGGEGSNLAGRIGDLKGKAIINGVLADWARHIRLEGNSAVHERSGTQEEAEELMDFTKLFLQYTFEFPHRIQELRNPKSI